MRGTPITVIDELVDGFKYKHSRTTTLAIERKLPKPELKHAHLKYFIDHKPRLYQASRKLEDLDPRMQERVKLFMEACLPYGFKIELTATRYSDEMQLELFKRGRGQCAGLQLVGSATSLHSEGLAFTFVPVFADAILEWGNGNVWRCAAWAASRAGLSWCGSYAFSEKDKVELIL